MLYAILFRLYLKKIYFFEFWLIVVQQNGFDPRSSSNDNCESNHELSVLYNIALFFCLHFYVDLEQNIFDFSPWLWLIEFWSQDCDLLINKYNVEKRNSVANLICFDIVISVKRNHDLCHFLITNVFCSLCCTVPYMNMSTFVFKFHLKFLF